MSKQQINHFPVALSPGHSNTGSGLEKWLIFLYAHTTLEQNKLPYISWRSLELSCLVFKSEHRWSNVATGGEQKHIHMSIECSRLVAVYSICKAYHSCKNVVRCLKSLACFCPFPHSHLHTHRHTYIHTCIHTKYCTDTMKHNIM